MYLSRVFIKNFRSIETLDLEFQPGKNIIVGKNNSGKSNIISAINLVLGEATPDYKKSENISESDFYTKRVRANDGVELEIATEIFIWCQLVRLPEEALDYDSLYSCFGFYVVNESGARRYGPRIRFPLQDLGLEYPSIFQITDDIDAKTYLNPKLRHQQIFEQEFDDKHQFAFAFRAELSSGLVDKEIRLLYRENDHSGWMLALRASIRSALIQSAIIPSFRDPQAQLRVAPWSWYGKLLRHLTAGSTSIPAVENALKILRSAANNVFEGAQQQIARSTLSVAFPGTTISFQFSTDRGPDLYRNCVIYVDDGFRSLLTEKGSGIQSATIIGLFCFYTKEVNILGSALLCVEEPELYLHPHAQRVLSDRMEEFIDENRNQVVLTTHSVEFLRTIGADVNVILVQRDASGPTTARNVSLKQFSRLLRDNNQNELFFANKVIVCEGYEDILLRYAAREMFPGRLDEDNISIISVNGKDNLCKLAELIMKLGINCYVLADFDFILRDKAEERKKYQAKAHDSLASFPAAFFNQLPSILDGHQFLSCLQRFRSSLKNYREVQFYTAKECSVFGLENFQPVLRQMRLSGIGILDAEIENLSRDTTLVSTSNKLDLSSIQEIKIRLVDGKNLSDLFDLTQIKEFLSSVFQENSQESTLLNMLTTLCEELDSLS